jgi:hypothetical protein
MMSKSQFSLPMVSVATLWPGFASVLLRAEALLAAMIVLLKNSLFPCKMGANSCTGKRGETALSRHFTRTR